MMKIMKYIYRAIKYCLGFKKLNIFFRNIKFSPLPLVSGGSVPVAYEELNIIYPSGIFIDYHNSFFLCRRTVTL